jgi:hypothetical protein
MKAPAINKSEMYVLMRHMGFTNQEVVTCCYKVIDHVKSYNAVNKALKAFEEPKRRAS